MAEGKEYIKLWMSYDSYFEPLSAEEIGNLILAMMEYRRTGDNPCLEGNERFVWPAIKRDMDESARMMDEKADRNRENGKTGGRPRKTQMVSEKPTETQKTQMVSEKPTERHGLRTKDKGLRTKDNTPKPPKGDFDRFWSAYPRKVGKEAAWKSFCKVEVPVEQLLQAIERQKCSDQWKRDNGRFVPNPATWLNQCRWEDELPPADDKPKHASYGNQPNDDIAWMAKYIDKPK